MSLRERILARLALAEAATPGPWKSDRWLVGDGHVVDDSGITVGPATVGYDSKDDAAFIADRDPAAVIRECRADLALLNTLERWLDEERDALMWTNLNDRYPEGDA